MSDDDMESQLYQASTTHQLKYDFFLMATAASGIALSVSNTRDLSLQYSMIPLGIAVAFWSISFLAGCFRQGRISKKLLVNQRMFTLPKLLPDHLRTHEVTQATTQQALDEIKDHQKSAEWLMTIQFTTLVLGGFGYLTWHVLGMYLRTVGTVTTQLA